MSVRKIVQTKKLFQAHQNSFKFVSVYSPVLLSPASYVTEPRSKKAHNAKWNKGWPIKVFWKGSEINLNNIIIVIVPPFINWGNRTFPKLLLCNWTSGYRWSTSVLLRYSIGNIGTEQHCYFVIFVSICSLLLCSHVSFLSMVYIYVLYVTLVYNSFDVLETFFFWKQGGELNSIPYPVA